MDLAQRSTTLRLAFGALAAAVAAAGYVVVVGYLDVRAVADMAGASLDWSGTVVAITPPVAPWWPSVGMAAVTAVAFLLAWRSRANALSRRQLLPLWVAAATVVALWLYFMATTEFPYGVLMVRADADPEPVILAWMRQGVLSPATPAFAGVLAVLALLRPGRRPAPAAPDSADADEREAARP